MVLDISHSRLVAWLKVLLPLAALAILSSLFLVSRGIDPESAIPYSDVDVAARLDEPRLTAPVFTGMTDDGAAVTVTAADMRPLAGRPGRGTARRLTVRLEAASGTVTTLEAETAWMDTATEEVVLGGGVTVVTSTGYRLTAPDMQGSIARTDLLATGGVAGDSPFGPVSARMMQITPDPTVPGSHVLDFKGDVRLIYRPDR
jgi:lipopolysaccharide export system protein LptC